MTPCRALLTLTYRQKGIATNEANVEYLAATLQAKLDGYEAILSKQKYVAGDVSPDSTSLVLLSYNLTRNAGVQPY